MEFYLGDEAGGLCFVSLRSSIAKDSGVEDEGQIRERKADTNGIYMSNSSSASLLSSGSSSNLSAHVFFTIPTPDCGCASFRVRILSKSICEYRFDWRAGVTSLLWS